jgi:hypothetical protein
VSKCLGGGAAQKGLAEVGSFLFLICRWMREGRREEEKLFPLCRSSQGQLWLVQVQLSLEAPPGR